MSSTDELEKSVKRLFRAMSLEEASIDYKKAQPWVLARKEQAKFELKVGPFRFDAEKFVALASPHPLTRRMTASEMEVMKDSIWLNGVQTEVYVDATGRVVDGFHRVLCCAEILLQEGEVRPLPFRVIDFSNSDKEAEFVILHHMVGRHFTIDDKRAMAETLLRSGHDGTAGCIADLVNLATNTVKSLLEDLILRGEIHYLEKRRDSRGSYHNQLRPVQKTLDNTVQALDDDSPNLHPPKRVKKAKPAVPKAKQTPQTPADEMSTEDLRLEVSGGSNEGDSSKVKRHDIDDKETTEIEEEICASFFSNPSDMKAIMELWWDKFGLEPTTPLELLEAMADSEILLAYCDAETSLFGKTLKMMVQSKGSRFSVLSKQVRSGSVYFIRPRGWTKHGPA